MKSNLNWPLPLSPQLSTQTPRQMVYLKNWGARLNAVWQRTKAQFAFSSEPQVWQTTDHTGRHVWSAYDPTTGRTIEQVSAKELRVWLEERYHRKQSATEQRMQQVRASQLYHM
jgi:hypothetical protein